MALIKQAKREQVKTKVLLMSPSGAGKTYSALRLAKGMGGRTLLIDTEARRGLYYADEFDYEYVELKEVLQKDDDYKDYKEILPRINEPFAPENYIALIRYAVDNGFNNLIIDSLTHEWNAKGGILDTKNKMPGANDFTKWKTLTPRHDAFIYEILHSPINVIATVRGKDEYILEDKDGKKQPKKIGLGAVQRDGMEYEYTITFNIDQETHVAYPQKDNTHLFEGRYDMLSEKDGAALVAWANKGETNASKDKSYQNKKDEPLTDDGQETELDEIKSQINTAATEKISEGVDKDTVYAVIVKHNKKKNPAAIKDLDTAKTILKEIQELKLEGE